MDYVIKINRGTKLPHKRVHQVNVQIGNDPVNLKAIYAGGNPWDASRVFGCGNPTTTGSTGGERRVISRRNISKFVRVGTAIAPIPE